MDAVTHVVLVEITALAYGLSLFFYSATVVHLSVMDAAVVATVFG